VHAFVADELVKIDCELVFGRDFFVGAFLADLARRLWDVRSKLDHAKADRAVTDEVVGRNQEIGDQTAD
jgi:hypothetical protein